MAVISEISCAVPPYRVSKESISKVGLQWLSDNPDQRALFQRILNSCGVDSRHFFCDPAELLSIMSQSKRAKLFEKFGLELLSEALGNFNGREAPSTLITTSCSVPLIPSIDATLIQQLRFPLSTRRIPIYQHGCVGGVSGLSLASKLIAHNQDVWVASVELCSLVFHAEDQRGVSVVAASLFGDGAACARVEPQGEGLKIEATRSHLVPNTQECMGYDIFESGTHLRLHPELPQVLAHNLPDLMHEFLKESDLTPAQVKWWLFHPGGVKILQYLQNNFGLQTDQCKWSWDTLKNFGNMSSATILFVIEAFMRQKTYSKDDLGVIVGVGPGLTLELILFRCV